jgi:predicted transcriptional regulator
MAKSERIEFRASEEFVEELDRLAGADSTRADVIRRALALYSLAKKEESRGNWKKDESLPNWLAFHNEVSGNTRETAAI